MFCVGGTAGGWLPCGVRPSCGDSRQPLSCMVGAGDALPGLVAELGTAAGVGCGPQLGPPVCKGVAVCGCGNGAGIIVAEPDIGRTACGIGRSVEGLEDVIAPPLAGSVLVAFRIERPGNSPTWTPEA